MRGRRSLHVRAEPVRTHVLDLIERGSNQTTIAEASGVDQSTLSDLVLGKRDLVHRDTANKLLSIKEPPRPYLVPTTVSARMLQALAVKGWSLPGIATLKPRWHKSYLSKIRSGSPGDRMIAATADEIAEFYAAHKDEYGGSNWTRLAAERNGWLGPEAWEGVDIRDPDAQPSRPPA